MKVETDPGTIPAFEEYNVGRHWTPGGKLGANLSWPLSEWGSGSEPQKNMFNDYKDKFWAEIVNLW